MAGEAAYLIQLASWLGTALSESRAGLTVFNTHELGIALPDNVAQSPSVIAAVNQLISAGDIMEEAASELESQASGSDELALIAALSALGVSLGEFFYVLRNLQLAIVNSITPATIPDAVERAEALVMAQGLSRGLGDLFLGNAITMKWPLLASILKILGLFDWRRVDAEPTNLVTRTYVVKRLQLQHLKNLINDPVNHLQNTHGWGQNDFDPTPFFELYADFLNEETSFEIGVAAGNPFLRHGSVTVRRTPGIMPPGLAVEWQDKFNLDFSTRVEFSDNWGLGFASNLGIKAGATGQILPPSNIVITPPAGELSGEFKMFFDRNPEQQPFDIVSGAGLITLAAENTSIGIGLDASWNPGTGQAEFAPLLFSDINGATLRLGSEDADGFIANLLAATEIEGQFDLGFEWSPSEGLRVRASGGVEIAIPIHRSLGPLDLKTLFFVLNIRDDGTLSFETSTELTANLGPMTATIERVGAQLDLLFVDDAEAKFGPFDVNLDFKPPNGVGFVHRCRWSKRRRLPLFRLRSRRIRWGIRTHLQRMDSCKSNRHNHNQVTR